mgnify:CR=1 FL=1
MGRDGMMWGADDDTMTLEEYRRLRGAVEHKKSDFIESIDSDMKEGSTDVWKEQ